MVDNPKHFKSQTAWRQWLEKNHATSSGIWLTLRRISIAKAGLTYTQALDGALCYGWIDGQKKSFDSESFLQRFAPRTQRSIWSQINREHVRRLIDSGEMQSAGLAEVDRAKADGRWEAAYTPQSRSQVPDDFAAALNANPKALAFFEKLSSQNRYAMLFRLQTVKLAETRVRKIETFIRMLLEGKTFH